MDTQNDQISDEELAESIDENGVLSSSEDTSSEGLVESAIQNDAGNDEKFSVDDFDMPLDGATNHQTPSDTSAEEENDGSTTVSEEGTSSSNNDHLDKNNRADSLESNGDVAEFRKTLSDLSRQLEVDRITLLHNKLRNKGKRVPDLSLIASDIKGDSQLHPIGDEDLYSKRPFSRLQGWIVGLSFGIGRRAKKFRR
jgi:hypothetical protein